MKKQLVTAILVILTLDGIAQDNKPYILSELYCFQIGDKKGEFGYKTSATDVEGPVGFGIKENGNIVVNDYKNKRNQVINKNGVVTNVVMVSDTYWAGSIDFFGKRLIGTEYGFLSIINENGKNEYFRDVPGHRIYCIGQGEVCFIYDNQILYSLPNPGPDLVENNRRILDEKATRALFTDPVKYGLVGVQLDNKNRLFVNGELETRDYWTFDQYWADQYPDYPRDKRHKYPVYSEDTSPYIQFVGKDVKGNVYWNVHNNKILVYDNHGIVIDRFEYDREKSKTLPAVHPSGDVYFLDYDENAVSLYRVENVWDKAGRAFWYETNATVTSPNVRLREKPSLSGAEQGYLQTDERVAVLETSAEMTRVGDTSAPWYRVKTKSGLTAWAFGGFIDLDEE
jgi:hypothetical protein